MKRVLCIVAVLLSALSLSCPLAYAAKGADFWLSGTECKKGRLLYTTLCVSGGEGMAAFLADIGYDADALSFRSASAVTGTVRVNSEVSGKLKLVYLFEDGITSDRAELVRLCFMADTAADTEIELAVSQLINNSGGDMAVGRTDGADITAGSAGEGGQTAKSDKKPGSIAGQPHSDREADITDGSASKDSVGTIVIEADGSGFPIPAVVALVAAAGTGTAVIAYRLGRRKAQKHTFSTGNGQSDTPDEGGQTKEEKDEKNP